LGTFGLIQKQTDVAPKQKEDIQLKIITDGKLKCGVCHRTFTARNEFDGERIEAYRFPRAAYTK
jgi:hypothetical protein